MEWSDFLFEQANLAQVCRPPAVWATEYHIENQLYGGHFLVKEYAGLDPHRPLPWVMEHFVNFKDSDPYVAAEDSRLPIFATVASPNATLAHVPQRVVPIGAMYFYMRAIAERWYPELAEPVARRGTLVMPAKSTQGKTLDFDRERFAAELATLPDEFHPVVVSVFYRDYERGSHSPYVQAGLQVVSSGHPYDPLFLFRQYDLCRRFRYACANEISTSFCVSVLSGCRFFHHATVGLRVTGAAGTREHDQEGRAELPAKLACRRACPFPPPADTSEQVRLAEHFAGARFVRSPEFLRALADDGRAALRASVPGDIDFDARVRTDALAAWSMQGVDVDGLALERFELTVPSGAKATAAAIDLVFGPDGHATEWRMTLDGAGRHRFRPQPDGVRILVPSRPGHATRVEFAADGPPRLPDPVRRRSARVVAVRLLHDAVRVPRLLPRGERNSRSGQAMARDAHAAVPLPPSPPRPAAASAPAPFRLGGTPRFFGRLHGLAMRSRPFEHATRADGVDANTAEALLGELPSPDRLREMAGSGGSIHGLVLLEDPRFGPTWKALAEEGLSQEHYLRWLALFRPWIDRRHPDLDARFGRLERLRAVPRQRLRPGAGEVGLECQLAFQVAGATAGVDLCPPHIGRPHALIRALIDLRWPGDHSAGGELEFSVPIEPAHCLEPGRRLPRTSVRTTHVFPRENGRLVTFLNSRDALHGRAPRGPAEVPSLYVDLAVEFPEPLFPVFVRGEPPVHAAAPAPPARLPFWQRVKRRLRDR